MPALELGVVEGRDRIGEGPTSSAQSIGVGLPCLGEVLAGKYRLKRILGEGGMGMVLEAEHLRLRQPIAIKFLNPAMLGVSEIVARFDREARAAATLRSRHVVRVTDVEQTESGVPYMVMELLDGYDLETARETRGQLPYSEAADYVLQACGALAEAHDAGIVHRDLKPGNLFLAKEDADRVVVKVLDFGISKFMKGEDAKLTSAGAIMGTALYMSPEQIRGDGSIDGRSDIWSLGVILYELIGGRAPWTGATTRVAAGVVSEEAPDIRGLVSLPEPLAQTIHSMLDKDRGRRPQTILDVVFALAPYAPPGSVGAEVADHLARRSQRSLGAQRSTAILSTSSITPAKPATSPSSSQSTQPTGPSQPIPVESSDRIQLVISTRANPERSTMAATTTSLNMRVRPKIWGALVGFGALALVGIVMIFVVAHKRVDGVVAERTTPPPTAVTLDKPIASGTLAPPPPDVSTSASSSPTTSVAVSVVKVTPTSPATPPAPTGKRPPAIPPSGKIITAPRPSETAPPLFLK